MGKLLYRLVALSMILSSASLLFAQDQKKQEQTEMIETPTRTEKDILRIPSQSKVITKEDIKKSGALTIVDLLKTQGGFFVRQGSSTPQDAEIDARGFNNGSGSGQRTVVLVDGRRVNTVTGTSTDWAMIPLENIEKIEIVQGPLAFLYGDGAVAAVVNIITKKKTGTTQNLVGSSAASYSSFKEFLDITQIHDGWSYSIFAQKEQSDGYRANSAYEGLNYVFYLQKELQPGLKFAFKGAFHKDDRERPGTLTLTEIASVGRNGTVTQGDESNVDQFNLDFLLQTSLAGGDFSAFATFWGDGSDSRTTFVSGTSTIDDISRVMHLNLKYVRKLSLFGLQNQLISGVDLGWERASADSLNNFPAFFFVSEQDNSYKRRLLGIYVLDETSLTSSLLLSSGFRLDRATLDMHRESRDVLFSTTTVVKGKRDYDFLNPHIGLTWLIGNDQSVYGSWSRTFRYPNRNELIGFLSTSNELVPERASVFEVGFKSRSTPLLYGGISIYHMNVEDELSFNPPAVGAVGQFGRNENFPQVSHRGASLELHSVPTDTIELFSTYSIFSTKVQEGPFEGNVVPITPKHTASIGFTLHPTKNLQITPILQFVGSRFMLNDLDNGTPKLGGYSIVDMKTSYKIGQCTAFLLAKNLFDKEYFDSGGIGGSPWGSRRAFNPAPERNFLLGVEVIF